MSVLKEDHMNRTVVPCDVTDVEIDEMIKMIDKDGDSQIDISGSQ